MPTILAAAALAWSAATAGAAIPPAGRVADGVGPSFGRIGTPAQPVARRLALRCTPVARGPAQRCRSRTRPGAGGMMVDGAGLIEGWVFERGGWRGSRGVGIGATVARVREAYGTRLRTRRAGAAIVLEERRTIAGTPRLTRFEARAATGRVTRLTVLRVRRNLVRPASRTVPADGGATLLLTDFAPRTAVRVSAYAPGWQSRPARATGAVSALTDAAGRARVVLPRDAGPLALLLARRPPATRSPVAVRVVAGAGADARAASLRVALPRPASLTIAVPRISTGTPAGLTLVRPEPLADYEIDAEWACADGSRGAAEGLTAATLVSPTGADVAVTLDLPPLQRDVFAPDCAGPAAQEAIPVSLLLVRTAPTRSGAIGRERVVRLTVPLTAAPPES
ncbi:MAG: hypothetical protein AB7V42_12350 [Thermoleophilia bacterium]